MAFNVNQANQDVDQLKEGWSRFKTFCTRAVQKLEALDNLVATITEDAARKAAAVDVLEASGTSVQQVTDALAAGKNIVDAIKIEFPGSSQSSSKFYVK